jgi:acetoin utilization deacetylase AcuC-like enzyme
VAAMRAVCGSQNVLACHLAGGTHHAFRGFSLYCKCCPVSLPVNSLNNVIKT